MAEQEIDNGPKGPQGPGELGGDTTEQADLDEGSTGHLDDPELDADLDDEDIYDEPEELEPEEGAPDDIPMREQLQATYNEGSAEVVQGAWRDTLTEDEKLTSAAVATFDVEGSAEDYSHPEEVEQVLRERGDK